MKYYIIQHGEPDDYISGTFSTYSAAVRFAEQTRYQEAAGNIVVEAIDEQSALQRAKGRYA